MLVHAVLLLICAACANRRFNAQRDSNQAATDLARVALHRCRRWCSFGSAVAGTNAKVTFYEYGQDGSVLHQTMTNIKARKGWCRNRCVDGARICNPMQPASHQPEPLRDGRTWSLLSARPPAYMSSAAWAFA